MPACYTLGAPATAPTCVHQAFSLSAKALQQQEAKFDTFPEL